MNAERWQKIQNIFEALRAIPKETWGSRIRKLSQGDTGIEKEVWELVRAQPEQHPYLERKDQMLEIPGFRDLKSIGKGGMGSVFRATQVSSNLTVAIKVLHAKDDVAMARFEREHKLLKDLRHQNIVQNLGSNITADGQPYIVMEYVKGQPITTYAKKRKLSLPQRLELWLDVAKALQFAHERRIIHRDIKPNNVFVTQSGVVKLLDFGIAKLNIPMGHEKTITRDGSSFFSPHFSAPEQIGGQSATPQMDIYSLSILLRLLVSGTLPGQASPFDFEAMGLSHLSAKARNAWQKKVERTFLPIIDVASNSDPSQRFTSIAEMLRQFENSRSRRWIWAAVAGTLVLLAVGTFSFWPSEKKKDQILNVENKVQYIIQPEEIEDTPAPEDYLELKAIQTHRREGNYYLAMSMAEQALEQDLDPQIREAIRAERYFEIPKVRAFEAIEGQDLEQLQSLISDIDSFLEDEDYNPEWSQTQDQLHQSAKYIAKALRSQILVNANQLRVSFVTYWYERGCPNSTKELETDMLDYHGWEDVKIKSFTCTPESFRIVINLKGTGETVTLTEKNIQ